MEIVTLEGYEQVSQAAARLVADQIRRKPDAVLGLATGATPMGMYRELVRMHREEGLSFARVTTFNLDEYYGLVPSDPRSYRRFMEENLFAHVDADAARVHLPDGLAPDVEAECERYEAAIAEAGGIDLQVLGIGRNGHIGFNEPGTLLGTTTQVVDLTEETVTVNSRLVQAEIPRRAISMGIKSIMRSRAIILLACGPEKAEIVARALEGPVTPDLPASILQLHPNLTVMLDRAAAARLNKTQTESRRRRAR
jgi:glucosamine-6-phosphate deaminase